MMIAAHFSSFCFLFKSIKRPKYTHNVFKLKNHMPTVHSSNMK